MAVEYRRREPGASPELVERLEARIGTSLPPEYREYLLAQDGGRLASNDGAVKNIFGLDDVPEWASMWENLDVYNGRVPSWLLPVADDEYGNLYAISVRPADFGSVWFWDHEEEADEGEPASEENISLKAASWSGFLEGLQVI